jgi:wyosine [tRNA(Phe)-imidazoG37] synthetase (radical SAM superfamily)
MEPTILKESSEEGTSNKEKSIASIHDFKDKLLQPSTINVLKEYILWQSNIRNSENPEILLDKGPESGPISINLDLTTACNYACDHCVDMDILNKGINHDYEKLLDSLDNMQKNGLKSVILIGGGEPTIHPRFTDMVKFLKDKEIQIAVVSNGSNVPKISEVGNLFGDKDWVRLSLDSGTDETFQAMHKSRKKITLGQICDDVLELKEKHPNVRVGFSYIVTWNGANINDRAIIPNIHEIVLAAKLAKDHCFDYISIKPFLERAPENNAEVVGINNAREDYEATMEKIRGAIKEAKKLETEKFKVIESTNLRVMQDSQSRDHTVQPRNCHMTFFRQVLSPLGVFICPAYRHVDKAKVGENTAYTSENYKDAKLNTSKLIQNFDSSEECKKITCLYNEVNWYVEDLIDKARTDPEIVESLKPTKEKDYFL